MTTAALAEPPEGPLRIEELCRKARSYLTAEQTKDLRRAYQFGAEAHAGQTRQSGEPYIQHPLAVALILASMHKKNRW